MIGMMWLIIVIGCHSRWLIIGMGCLGCGSLLGWDVLVGGSLLGCGGFLLGPTSLEWNDVAHYCDRVS